MRRICLSLLLLLVSVPLVAQRQAGPPATLLVRNVTLNDQRMILVAGNSDRGALYGAFALIRHLATGGKADALNLRSAPKVKLRVLNHWDNLDGSIERGYAGQSLWDWWTLPDFRDPRYTDYARANASIGINGTVLNNVNAKADSLTAPYIAKAAALADVFRPWGIKVYLSVRFSAPIELGGLKTADPRDPAQVGDQVGRGVDVAVHDGRGRGDPDRVGGPDDLLRKADPVENREMRMIMKTCELYYRNPFYRYICRT